MSLLELTDSIPSDIESNDDSPRSTVPTTRANSHRVGYYMLPVEEQEARQYSEIFSGQPAVRALGQMATSTNAGIMSGGTPDLYVNTSLEQISLSRQEKMQPSRVVVEHRRRLREAQVQERRRQVELEAEMADDAMFAKAADRKYEELRKHREMKEPLLQVALNAMLRYKKELPTEHAGLLRHVRDIKLLAQTEVREYDMIRWYEKKMPYYLLLPLRDLSRYFHTDAKLQVVLDEAEKDAGSWGSAYLHPEVRWAAERYQKSDYGFESEVTRKKTFEVFPELSQDAMVRQSTSTALVIEASFRARVIRVEHADSSLRYPACQDWRSSLDYSLSNWVKNVQKTVAPALKHLDRDNKITPVLKSMEKYVDILMRRRVVYDQNRRVVESAMQDRREMLKGIAVGDGLIPNERIEMAGKLTVKLTQLTEELEKGLRVTVVEAVKGHHP